MTSSTASKPPWQTGVRVGITRREPSTSRGAQYCHMSGVVGRNQRVAGGESRGSRQRVVSGPVVGHRCDRVALVHVSAAGPVEEARRVLLDRDGTAAAHRLRKGAAVAVAGLHPQPVDGAVTLTEAGHAAAHRPGEWLPVRGRPLRLVRGAAVLGLVVVDARRGRETSELEPEVDCLRDQVVHRLDGVAGDQLDRPRRRRRRQVGIDDRLGQCHRSVGHDEAVAERRAGGEEVWAVGSGAGAVRWLHGGIAARGDDQDEHGPRNPPKPPHRRDRSGPGEVPDGEKVRECPTLSLCSNVCSRRQRFSRTRHHRRHPRRCSGRAPTQLRTPFKWRLRCRSPRWTAPRSRSDTAARTRSVRSGRSGGTRLGGAGPSSSHRHPPRGVDVEVARAAREPACRCRPELGCRWRTDWRPT